MPPRLSLSFPLTRVSRSAATSMRAGESQVALVGTQVPKYSAGTALSASLLNVLAAKHKTTIKGWAAVRRSAGPATTLKGHLLIKSASGGGGFRLSCYPAIADPRAAT